MAGLKLLYPVYTLDNKLLLPAGSVLSAETLNALISSNRYPDYQNVPFCSTAQLRKICSSF